MTKFMMPLVLCGLAVLQTVRVEAIAGEGETQAKPTPALRAADRPPVALDSKGRVLPTSSTNWRWCGHKNQTKDTRRSNPGRS